MSKEINKVPFGKGVVVFEQGVIDEFESLGLVMPFKKWVESIVYANVQMEVDRRTVIVPPEEATGTK